MRQPNYVMATLGTILVGYVIGEYLKPMFYYFPFAFCVGYFLKPTQLMTNKNITRKASGIGLEAIWLGAILVSTIAWRANNELVFLVVATSVGVTLIKFLKKNKTGIKRKEASFSSIAPEKKEMQVF